LKGCFNRAINAQGKIRRGYSADCCSIYGQGKDLMVRFIGFLLIAFLTLSSNAYADDARPLHIEINEVGENAFDLQ